jgi:MerR family transcriptional regulator, copper efflux regulator
MPRRLDTSTVPSSSLAALDAAFLDAVCDGVQEDGNLPPGGASVDDGQRLTIGDVVAKSGLTARTLRYYEELDLIAPISRSEGGYRLFNTRTLKRLRAIVSLQDLGFSLDNIRQILGSATHAMLPHTRTQRVQRSRDTLSSQLQAVEGRIQAFETLKDELMVRLQHLEDHCDSCALTTPESDCEPTCTFRSVHVD